MKELNVIHIGAKGDPVSQWLSIGEYVNLHGIDANDFACKELEKKTRYLKSQQFYNYVIAGYIHYDRKLYKTISPECYSLLEPNYSFWKDFEKSERCEVLETVPVNPITLTTFVDRHMPTTPDFLKMDIQGIELEVLREYKYLKRLSGIEVELSFAPLYKEQDLAHKVMSFLYENGFIMVGLKRCRWKHGTKPLRGGQLIFGDALFLRGQRKNKLDLICKAYKLYDFIGEGMESSIDKLRYWDSSYGY